MVDNWQQAHVMSLGCKLSACHGKALKYIHDFAYDMKEIVRAKVQKRGNGAWINACDMHTQLNHGHSWDSVFVHGATLRDTFYGWYNLPNEGWVKMDDHWGSNDSC
jgi:hypothetical protein